jgi:hypothetical protein
MWEVPRQAWDLAPGSGPEVGAFLDRFSAGMSDQTSVHTRLVVSTPTGTMRFEADAQYGAGGDAMRALMATPDTEGVPVLILMVGGRVYIGVPGTGAERYFTVPPGHPLARELTAQEISPLDSLQRFEDSAFGCR